MWYAIVMEEHPSLNNMTFTRLLKLAAARSKSLGGKPVSVRAKGGEVMCDYGTISGILEKIGVKNAFLSFTERNVLDQIEGLAIKTAKDTSQPHLYVGPVDKFLLTETNRKDLGSLGIDTQPVSFKQAVSQTNQGVLLPEMRPHTRPADDQGQDTLSPEEIMRERFYKARRAAQEKWKAEHPLESRQTVAAGPEM